MQGHRETVEWHTILRLEGPDACWVWQLIDFGDQAAYWGIITSYPPMSNSSSSSKCLVTTMWCCSISLSAAFSCEYLCLSIVSPLLLMTPNESPSSVTKGWEWASCAWVLGCSHKREFNNYICHTYCPCWLATWRYQGTLWSNIQIIGLKLLGCRMEEPRQGQFLEPDAFSEGQCSGYFVF